MVNHVAVAITDLEAPADGLVEPLGCDPRLLTYGPVENFVDRGHSGNEVVFHLAFPGKAPFESLETELLLGRDAIVEHSVRRQRTEKAETERKAKLLASRLRASWRAIASRSLLRRRPMSSASVRSTAGNQRHSE